MGSASGTIFTSARYCMVGAQYGYLPKIFSFIQKRRLTPLPGIVLQVSGFYEKLICPNFFVLVCLLGIFIDFILYSKQY